LSEKGVTERLQSAAGANYDLAQNSSNARRVSETHTTEFSSYKKASRDFFAKIEKNTSIKNITYDDKPHSRQTPVDLSLRTMTVGASIAKANMTPTSSAAKPAQ
jgi:hypothetical protein